MPLLQLKDIDLHYGTQILLDGVSLGIEPSPRCNGSTHRR